MRYLVKKIPNTSLVHYTGDKYYCEIAGGSEETKPSTGILTGSKFLETDTGKWKVFDETAGTWTETKDGGTADPEVVAQAVSDWLDEHPEATTTVQDGSITEAKLASALATKVNTVSSLSEEIVGVKSAINSIVDEQKYNISNLGFIKASLSNSDGQTYTSSNNYLTMTGYVARNDLLSFQFTSGQVTTLYAFTYNANKEYVERITVGSNTAINNIPAGYFIRFSFYKSAVTMADVSSALTLSINTGLNDRISTIENQIEQEAITWGHGTNLFQPSAAVQHAWYYTSGTTIKNPTTLLETSMYCAYAVENIDGLSNITIRGSSEMSDYGVYVYYITDENNLILSSGNVSKTDFINGKTIAIPNTANRLLLSITNGVSFATGANNSILMINTGSIALPYEPYETICYINGVRVSGVENGSVTSTKIANNAVTTEKIEDGAVTPEKLSGAIFDSVKLKCPSAITAIVGDKIELFYKGMINAVNTDLYEVDISFSDNKNRGQGWKRKYTWRPVADDVGTYTMTVKLLSNAGQELDSATITVNVVATPTSPVSQKVVLCVGDSLTAGGQWPIELSRRLTGSGGTPAGYNLNNYTFIGTKEKSGVKYEGYGGWTFSSYNTANTSDAFMWITTAHDKTQADQHSVYQASNGTQWYLETIEEGQIKIIRSSGSAALPSTGTLTWVSGGEHNSDIVYTASEQAAGNPFWDSVNSQNDFEAYATRMGVSSIDYCIILLGWNSTAWSESTIVTQANTFINRLQEQFPNCKVVLMGLEVPAYDGLAANYGISWKYYTKLQAVWRMQEAYESIAEDNNKVFFASVSAQFDTEYNMQASEMVVNTRNSQTVTVQNNGVHPANSGYLQIADVALRAIAGIL